MTGSSRGVPCSHEDVNSHGDTLLTFAFLLLPFILFQDGYETDVGEKSALLSGGQKQVRTATRAFEQLAAIANIFASTVLKSRAAACVRSLRADAMLADMMTELQIVNRLINCIVIAGPGGRSCHES